MPLVIKTVDIDKLFFDPSNARVHDNKNIDAIKGSIAQFSQVEPLIVNRRNNVVIGGNGRLAAMKSMGIKRVHVNYVDVSDSQAAALSIALNRSGELAKWDNDVLTKSLLALRDEDFALEQIGFDDLDMKKILGEISDEKPDDEKYKSMFEVVIECSDEAEQQEIYERLEAEGLKCRVLSM